MQKDNKILVDSSIKIRDPFIDVVKGVTILLVLIGHTIQYASGQEYSEKGLFYEHWLFKFIYGFHMPLFMIISGYLFYNTVQNKKWSTIVVGKLKTLILPIFSFAFIIYIFNFHSEYSVVDHIRHYLSCTRFTLWFLWALFYSSIGVLMVKILFKDNVFIYILLILGSFCTPDKWFSEMYKFMFPCFLVGYLCKKKDLMGYLDQKKRWIGMICGVVYIASLFVYSTNCYVYMSGCCLFKDGFSSIQLGINIFRIVVGIVGGISIISLLKWLYESTKSNKTWYFIQIIGLNTMGIYCIQNYFWLLFSRCGGAIIPIWINQTLSFCVSFIISFGITLLVKRIRPLNIILFGGR